MLRILTYHRVDDLDAKPTLDPKIISATPAMFEQHMSFLAKNYDVVSMNDVLAAVESGKRLPRRALLITFDDAYLDFKEQAWPIMQCHNLPATVFVPTAYPDEPERMFWWDRVYQLVLESEVRVWSGSPLGALELTGITDKVRAVRRLQSYIKRLSHVDAVAFVDELAEVLGGQRRQGQTVLDWDALRELAKQGVTLGAHTRTHPIMTQLSQEAVREEVVGSYSDLKREIGEVLPIFCYPNGGHDDEVVDILRQERFSIAFTTLDGHNDLSRTDPLRLRRTNITRKSTLPILRIRLQRWFTEIDRFRHREKKRASVS